MFNFVRESAPQICGVLGNNWETGLLIGVLLYGVALIWTMRGDKR